MKYNNAPFTILMTILLPFSLLVANPALAESPDTVNYLQHRWAEVNYQLEGKAQVSAFAQLAVKADQVTAANPHDTRAWIWSGIIKSTYAGAKGGLGALKIAKASKADLEKALQIDPGAMQGAAYTSLGTLYNSVPGWPLGFGSDKKAEKYLRKALAIGPDDIDSNYFYGTFLIDQKRYAKARSYLNKARQAEARPGRPIADAGRQADITKALKDIEAKE